MPEIYVYAVDGRDARTEARADEGHHRRGGEEFWRAGEAVVVQIVEAPKADKMKGGLLFSERQAAPAARPSWLPG